MSKIQIGVELVTPVYEIKRLLLKEIEVVINRSALITEAILKPYALDLFKKSINDSPEVKSLKGGLLQAELGPIDTKVYEAVNEIINEIINTFSLQVFLANATIGKLKLTIKMSVYPTSSTYTIANSNAGSYLSGKGVSIPWLSWLLLRGDAPIIANYYVNTNFTKTSRTGLAIMKKSNSKSWRVPPQFSGTEQNNFITRALDSVADNIVDKMVDTFEKNV